MPSSPNIVPITINHTSAPKHKRVASCDYKGQGSKENHVKMVEALNAMIRDDSEITVKGVCLRAGLRTGFDNNIRKTYKDIHAVILSQMEYQTKDRRQDERERLLSALERLRNNMPANTTPVRPGGYISIKKLMHESGIHESTINRYHKDICKECTDNKRINTDDVWFFGGEELTLQGGSDAVKVNFSEISPAWLKRSAKDFIKACHATQSSATLVANVHAIRMFGHDICAAESELKPSDIDRHFMEKMLYRWSTKNLKWSTRKRRLASLRQYLEWCEDTGSLQFGAARLIRDSDYPKPEGKLPKFIPETVMTQLNQHIDLLHPYVMRFFLVLQEVGMRISECCALSFDCIYPDGQGDFFIKYYQFKMKKDHVVPISKELAAVIQEQQQAVREEFGAQKDLLFPTPKMQLGGKRVYPRAGLAWSREGANKSLI